MKKNPAAVALGSIKSAKKAKSSRENGRKGGRKESKALRESREETFAALAVIFEIRKAIGDPEGKLMLSELPKEVMRLRESLIEERNKAQELDKTLMEIKAALDEMGAPVASAIGCRLLVSSERVKKLGRFVHPLSPSA